ncbi:MAG: NAD(P)/FAD-dependent oxidoreductase, partial [Burkholderiales bacterium]
MMCAAVAGQRGRRVILLDHASKLGEKIRISGGGRCNFTNLNTAPEHFISSNPHFCRSALARYGPHDFIALVKSYGIGYHEKHRGQLFCDQSSEQIIELLRRECERGAVQWRMPCSVKAIRRENSGFVVATDQGEISTGRVVIASGGMSIPKIGASDYG